MINIQTEDFNHAHEYETLRKNADSDGAIVTFTGLVRDFNNDNSVSSIQIEHYPGMTEKSLMQICTHARRRWKLGQMRIIHRVGVIAATEQIVFVGVSSKHRQDAFDACQFIMDFLKTQAPIWKQEGTQSGMKWINAKQSDQQATKKWDV